METNPYDPPQDIASPRLPGVWEERIPVAVFTAVSITAAAASFLAPLAAVPLALLLVPTAYRTLRIRHLRREAGKRLDSTDLGILVVGSVFAAIPVGIASLIAFCCVCTPLGFAGMAISDLFFRGGLRYGPEPGVLGVCIFVALWVALLAGRGLLLRWRYLSQEVLRSERPQGNGPAPDPLEPS